ncbi:MAG: glycosyltransferase family 4 protein [Erysipelotrichaceae bacterium]|nr:glycosyltransferase family 4 protein [Erysipelotrichaceae bacterium]
MRICLLNDSFPPVIDGVTNTIVNYAGILQDRRDTEVMVGTPFYPEGGYEKYPYPVITWPSLNTSSLTGGYRAGYPLPVKEIGMMAEWQPDIIHTHCPFASLFTARSLRDASGAPVILTYHTKYDIDIRRTIAVPLLQEESIHALVHNISACDAVWTVSRGAGENLASLGYEGSWKVMPNGVDFARGRVCDEDVRHAIAGYDLPEDVPFFLFVGRLMNYKGLPLLFAALRQLKEEHDFRMVMIGRGADFPVLKKQLEEYRIAFDEKTEDGIVSHPGEGSGKVIFTGAIAERDTLRAWNTAADLFVFPSTFDTNGLVVREAAACGLASMLIRGSCSAEGISDGRNGFLVDETAESLSSFLAWACTHREELHQAGMHAMNEIYLSWQDAVNMAAKEYAVILEKKNSGQLPARKMLADDPLYTMAADAAILCQNFNAMDPPDPEGMLENLIALHEENRQKILTALQDRKKELADLIRQYLNHDE